MRKVYAFGTPRWNQPGVGFQWTRILLGSWRPRASGWEPSCLPRFATRPSYATFTVILLTARGDDVDRIVGLEIGADDFVPKEKVNADLSKSLTKSKPGCNL